MKRLFTICIVLAVSNFFANAQTLTDVIVPQYIQGINGTNVTRVPYAYRVTIAGLTANATYRYYNQVVTASEAATSNGAGNAIYPTGASTFTRTASVSLSTAGGYDSATTDASGAFTKWFITEPTANATRFVPGTQLYFRVILNNGASGTTAVTRLTTTNFATVINFGASGANTGTGIRMTTNASFTPSNFVMLYDNTSGTGRPIAGTYVENDGSANTISNAYVPFYGNSVDGVAQTWGTIIPNALTNGIQRIQEYGLITGLPTVAVTSADGTYPTVPSGTINTKNANGGTTELVINGGTIILPVNLLSFTAAATSNSTLFKWKTVTEKNTSHFEIEQSLNGRDFMLMATVAATGNSVTEKNYAYTGVLMNATTYYRLKMVDADGKFSTSAVVKVASSKNGFALGNVYPVPAKNNVTIEWNSNQASTVSLIVTDITGKTIRNVNVPATVGFNQYLLDVQSFSSSQYFIRLNNGITQIQTSITKQ